MKELIETILGTFCIVLLTWVAFLILIKLAVFFMEVIL